MFPRNEYFHHFSNRFQLLYERNGASPDDFTKWEVAKNAINSPQLEIKNANGVVGKKYRNNQEQ